MVRTKISPEASLRPEYERDFGHEVEELVEGLINSKVPGMHCEHASVSQDLTEATDTWLVLEQNDKRFPLAIFIPVSFRSGTDLVKRPAGSIRPAEKLL